MKKPLFKRRRPAPSPAAPTVVAPLQPSVIEYSTELTLLGSVGKGAKNKADDVEAVQSALNEIHPNWGGPELPLKVTGKCDAATTAAIKRIQQWHFGKGDGRLDPKKGTHRKIQQILDGYVDIFVAQQPSDASDGASVLINDFWLSEIQTISVADMVDKIQRRLQSDTGKKIMYLVVIGHGRPGLQRVGPGPWDGEHHLMLKELVDDVAPKKGQEWRLGGKAEAHLSKLRGCFHYNAVVSLCGCRIAGSESSLSGTIDGRNLLKGVSKALGNVNVQSGTAEQYDTTAGIEGICWRARNDALWIVTGRGFWGPEDDAEFQSR